MTRGSGVGRRLAPDATHAARIGPRRDEAAAWRPGGKRLGAVDRAPRRGPLDLAQPAGPRHLAGDQPVDARLRRGGGAGSRSHHRAARPRAGRRSRHLGCDQRPRGGARRHCAGLPRLLAAPDLGAVAGRDPGRLARLRAVRALDAVGRELPDRLDDRGPARRPDDPHPGHAGDAAHHEDGRRGAAGVELQPLVLAPAHADHRPRLVRLLREPIHGGLPARLHRFGLGSLLRLGDGADSRLQGLAVLADLGRRPRLVHLRRRGADGLHGQPFPMANDAVDGRLLRRRGDPARGRQHRAGGHAARHGRDLVHASAWRPRWRCW